MGDADTLRRAAALMRERIEAARLSPGPPWHTVGALMGGGKYRADAEYIASWDPAMAQDVAGLYESLAAALDSGMDDNFPPVCIAVRGAQRYLGEG